MRVTSSADWRGNLEFDTPVLVADILPGEPARCSLCVYGTDPWPRTELWAVKLHHPKHHDGDVRFYCAEHVPAAKAAPEPIAQPAKRSSPRSSAVRAPRTPRPTPAAERPRAVCPNCFIEVPPTGICGMCGETVPLAG
ncbi:glucose-6-phosphate dehydrogenase [Microbacterium candidum]|uniref:Glucose-6-phosphate dehydrogenase n=1 Tax=Microbacterium candidum TaxID=3041922 RepID=A0ABT7MTZ6_9MICO|nr:glucose-6-phosphate dehydrogenase [Microbacterium sp. ASV49]MDL9977920.1 glucose-6-phosphate dehydrogenase [Microbacterium sp. ASV49]